MRGAVSKPGPCGCRGRLWWHITAHCSSSLLLDSSDCVRGGVGGVLRFFCLLLFADQYRARATGPQPRIKKRAKKKLEKSSDPNPPAPSYSIETHPDTTTEGTRAANSGITLFISSSYHALSFYQEFTMTMVSSIRPIFSSQEKGNIRSAVSL